MFKHTNSNKGFTLVELLAVVVIISILAAIAVPSVVAVISKTEEEVCKFNCKQLERYYNTHLALEGIEHSEVIFSQYLQEYDGGICEENTEITYVDGKLQCSLSTKEDSDIVDEEEENEGLPFF